MAPSTFASAAASGNSQNQSTRAEVAGEWSVFHLLPYCSCVHVVGIWTSLTVAYHFLGRAHLLAFDLASNLLDEYS